MNEYEISGIENIARGICIVDGKVLLCKPKKGGYTYLPGGHIEFGETGRQALVREMKEETGLVATAGDLVGVVESQFEQHGKPHAEISLVYKMGLEGLGGLRGLGGLEGSGGLEGLESLEEWIGFEWRSLGELDAANLLPVEMRTIVTQPSTINSQPR